MPRQGQRHRLETPAQVIRGHRFATGGFPGPSHTISQSLTQDATVGRRSIIVFASPDVAASPVEVDMQCLRHGDLAQKARDTWKIRIGDTRPVVALGMGGIIAQHRHRAIVVPETHQRNHGVDDSFGLRPQCGVGRCGVPDGAHLAIRTKDAAVRCHLAHFGLTGPNLIERPGLQGRPRDGVTQTPQ